jgi:1-acyl-sn-glycerol-3-phosphate acyltransferase
MEEWTYEPPADLDKSLAERLRDFPREPHMWVFALRSACALAMRAWLRIYHRFEIHGRERLPTGGSFVMVANHQSHLDAPSLLAAVPVRDLHRAFPAAAADYFFESLPRSAFSAIAINALPFDREAKGAESLAVCRALLANPGNILVLFPEGTRSKDGQVGRFKTGIGRLLVGTDVPVVPCFLSGAHEAFPKGAWFPRPRKLVLRIGEARSYGGLPEEKDSVRRICAELRAEVEALGALAGDR